MGRKLKREKSQRMLRSRLALVKAELADPAAKKVRRTSLHLAIKVIGWTTFVGWPRTSPRPLTIKESLTLPY